MPDFRERYGSLMVRHQPEIVPITLRAHRSNLSWIRRWPAKNRWTLQSVQRSALRPGESDRGSIRSRPALIPTTLGYCSYFPWPILGCESFQDVEESQFQKQHKRHSLGTIDKARNTFLWPVVEPRREGYAFLIEFLEKGAYACKKQIHIPQN